MGRAWRLTAPTGIRESARCARAICRPERSTTCSGWNCRPICCSRHYNTAYQLAPFAWPQTQEDGNGPSVYTGTIPYGVTIGIAANAVEPTAVKANAGANMLWHALQNHGAMVRHSGGSGNTVIFQADQTVDGSNPLILGMEQYGAQIMAQAQILMNQGPNSVNGGDA